MKTARGAGPLDARAGIAQNLVGGGVGDADIGREAGTRVQTGAVTVIQRFGSAAPTPARLQALLVAMIARLMRLFVRRGVVVAEPDRTWIEETQDRDGDDATGMAAVPPCLLALPRGPGARATCV